MDHEKLVSDLRAYAEWADANEYDVPLDLPDLLREAANMIEQGDVELAAMRSAAQSLKMALDKRINTADWIPVSEKLPELRDTWWHRTLIVCKKGYVMPMNYERDIVHGKVVNRWKWTWGKICDDPEYITHWTPLPEPPEVDVEK